MAKNKIFPLEYIKTMTWEESFSLAKAAWNNAERLHNAAILLSKNGYTEQAYNNLFIACEEYFKAKSFDGIAYVKMKGISLNEETLVKFVDNVGYHEWKFDEAFMDAELNIDNVTIKVEEGTDDTEIQENLHKEMQETFNFLNALNPYYKKNNSLYVGYNKNKNTIIIPQQEVTGEMVEKFFKICFYAQMACQVNVNHHLPSGKLSSCLEWLGTNAES